MTNGRVMKVESIAECPPLQYFWPALSENWSWKPICGLLESGSFRQVLLYHGILQKNYSVRFRFDFYWVSGAQGINKSWVPCKFTESWKFLN